MSERTGLEGFCHVRLSHEGRNLLKRLPHSLGVVGRKKVPILKVPILAGGRVL